ncbi:hypothetical protein LCGC14_0737910, partial [marine sediment metagenome]
MGKGVLFIIAFLIILIPFTFSFGYDNPTLPKIERIVEYLDKTGDSATGTYDFNGGWMNDGLTISGGDIHAQVGYFYNITSLNITKQNLTVLDDLIVNGNISLQFGDFVSEVNPDGADAIRIKGTDYVDVVIGGMTGLFAVWNVADNNAVFSVTERGNTVIAGDLTVDTDTLFVDAGNDRVGINTVSPDYPLHIDMGTFTGQTPIQKFEWDFAANPHYFEIGVEGVGQWGAYMNVEGTDVMSWQSSGKVGIGTMIPTHTLNVVGDVNFTNTIAAQLGQVIINDNSGSGLIKIINPTYPAFYLTDNTLLGDPTLETVLDIGDSWGFGNNTVMYVPYGLNGFVFLDNDQSNPVLAVDVVNDRVGIGTANPTTKLEVSNAGQSEIRITDSTASEYTQLTQIAADGNFEISKFGTGGTDFSIQPDGDIILAGTTIGNIGIGTVSPTAKLDVQDSAEEIVANFERTDDGALKMLLEANPLGVNQIWGFRNTGTFQVTDVTGGNLFPLQIEKATPTNTLYLKADGKVGIGTASPGEELEVAGDINSTGGDICITGGNCLSTVSGGGGGGNLTGGGTTNYIPKWSNATNLGNSLIYDNGANVGVGTNNPGKKLEIYKSSSPVAMRLKSVATGATNFVDLIQTSRNALGADAYFDILLDGTPFFELVHDGILDYFETTITGNLIVTGNITSENVFIPQYLYAHTNATIPILGASEWTNITFAQEDTDVKFGISHTYNDNA